MKTGIVTRVRPILSFKVLDWWFWTRLALVAVSQGINWFYLAPASIWSLILSFLLCYSAAQLVYSVLRCRWRTTVDVGGCTMCFKLHKLVRKHTRLLVDDRGPEPTVCVS